MVGRGAEGCAESRTYEAGGWEGYLRQGKESVKAWKPGLRRFESFAQLQENGSREV